MTVYTTARLTTLLLAATCAVGIALSPTLADEPASLVPDGVEAAADPATDAARLIWSMVTMIESEHMSAPARRELFGIVAHVLTGLDDPPGLERAVAEFTRCQSGPEFAERLEQCWLSHGRPKVSLNQIPAEMTKLLDVKLGPLHLIPAKHHVVQEQLRGNRYVGLGVAMTRDKDEQVATFVRIVPGGSAERAGLKPGTLVYEVDGRSTAGQPIEVVVDWLRGPAGSDVTLVVADSDKTHKRTVVLARGVVRFESLRDKGLTPLGRGSLRPDANEPVGWVGVADVTTSTLHELREAEARARSDGTRVMVLDFRSSSEGSDVHHARLVADALIAEGTIWNISEHGALPRPERSDRDSLFRNMSLVVVVDRHSGPAASAIAAALQDTGRATIVGVAPEFDGSFSTSVLLSDAPFALRMKTAMLSRSRRDRAWPLQPDYPVKVMQQVQPRSTVDIIQTVTVMSRSKAMALTPTIVIPIRAAVLSQFPASALNSANSKPAITQAPQAADRWLPDAEIHRDIALEIDSLVAQIVRELLNSSPAP